MIKTINKIVKKKIIRDIAMVATGTASAQIVTIICTPLITRLYSPEMIGTLGAFMAIIGIMIPISALSYPIAIVLQKKDLDAKIVFQLSIFIGTFIALLSLLLVVLAGDLIAIQLNLTIIHDYLIFIPITIFFSTFQQSSYQWLIRKQNYKLLAQAAFYQSVIINTVKVVMGWLQPLASVLVIITTFGYALYSVLLMKGLISFSKKEKISFFSVVHRNDYFLLAKQYSDFPLYRTPQIFINAISQGLPILLLASFFGTRAAGLYTLARTIMGLPATLIAKSVEDAIYPRLVRRIHNKQNISDILIKLTIGLAIVSFIPFAIVFFFGSEIFSFLFGINWLKSGEFASWLSIWLFFGFINKPCVAAIPVIHKQKWLFVYELFSTGTKIIVLYIGIFIFNNDIFAIILFSIAGSLAYIYLIFWVIWQSKKYGKQNGKKTN